MADTGIGASVKRKEDQRFITGKGQYTDDINRPGQTWAFFVRSPHAHATLKTIDASAALASPGCLAVLTGADIAKDKVGGLICGWMIHSKDGSPMKAGAHPALAQGKVRYVGDHVAVVIAETLAQARDAAEKVVVDYDVLPAAVDTATTQNAGQPQIHAEAPNNTVYQWHLGDKAKVDAAFAAAKHVTKIDLVNNRLIPNAIEPRAAIGDYDSGQDSFTLWTTSQNPHVARLVLAAFIGIAPEHKLRVIAPDVGGGFGSKIFIYAEETVCLWASKKVGRPVKWVADRTEAFLSDAHGRDHVTTAELALDASGKILALRAKTKANLGGYLSTFASCVPTYLYAPLLSGQYDIGAIYCEVDGVYTNTAPVDAYRGAGRPEATFVVERLVEVAARETGKDPAEFRRQNFIKSFPHATPVIMTYDAGDYAACLDKALELADYKGLGARKAASAKAGKKRGLGLLGLHRGLRHRAERGRRLAGCGRGPVGVGGGARQPDGLGGGADRLAQPRPGPRDHLRPAHLAAARHPHRAGHGGARRHRQGAVRHGHLRLALRRGRHVRDLLRHRQGDREGQEGGGLRAGGARADRRLQGRHLLEHGHQQDADLPGSGAAGLHRPQVHGRAAGAGPQGRRLLRSHQLHLPVGRAHLRGRDRSRDRHHHDRALDRGRRLRHAHQSDDRRGPGARRHRPGRRPGACSRARSTTRKASC